VLIAAFALVPCTAGAQEDTVNPGSKARTQQDIIRESEQACRGLKGEARAECLANYVGPLKDKPSGAWKRPPNPPKPQGRT